MKKLLEELEFQLEMFGNDMIDEQEFITALWEIHMHYKDNSPKYTKTYNEALKWFKKS